MKILTQWLREFVPGIPVTDKQLAEDLTLRGIAVEGVFEVPGGMLFEMDITTNRVDAMNHYGVAREAATIYDVPLKALEVVVPEGVAGGEFPVRIDAEEFCGRFTARVIRGVTIGESKGKTALYFEQLGQKMISDAVDQTNYCWLAMGHPTHAFDLDKLVGGIVVRRARAGEKIKLLDGTERVLFDDDLVIADEVKAVGLAGVMGGWDTMITAETKNVLVEAAWFEPAAIRRSSRRHGLHTDASHRFERGADLEAVRVANQMVTAGILAGCGGQVAGDLVDVRVERWVERTSGRKPVCLTVGEVRRQLGATEDGLGVTRDVVEQYLTALGCGLKAVGADEYEVTLPSWRLDLEREIDLIEEVARVYGYNRFANTLPAFSGVVVESGAEVREGRVRTALLALGFSEVVGSTFCSADEAAKFGPAGLGVVALGNPLSEEAGMLRPSLVPGMLGMIGGNLNRGVGDVRLFEMGTGFSGSVENVTEMVTLSLGATGGAASGGLFGEKDALFYEVKGAIEALLGKFVTGTVTYSAAGVPEWLETGRSAAVRMDGEVVAVFGEVSASEAAARKLKQAVVVGEVYLAKLFAKELRSPVSREVSRFQSVERDFSFVMPEGVAWGTVAAAIEGLKIAEMVKLAPVEIFRDAKKMAGQYSLLVRVVFQSAERTLNDAELGEWSARIVGAVQSLGGALRG